MGLVVQAEVVGLMDYETGTGKVRSLRLVADQARYGRGTFGVAVRSINEIR